MPSFETSTPVLTTTTTTTIAEISTQANDMPVGIKIKEITKPEEIRITDDRPKIFKPMKSSEVIPTKTSSSLYSAEIPSEPEFASEHQSVITFTSDDNSKMQQEIEPEIEQHTTFSFDDNPDGPIQLESTDLNTEGDVSMGTKIVRQTDNGNEDEVHTTIAPPSSDNEIKDDIPTTRPDHFTEALAESTTVMHNTSVLQVGDSVVIFNGSGQTQSIPLGIVGLQRGEDTYDEEDERKEGRKSDEKMQHSTSEFVEISSTDSTFEQSTTTQVYEVFYYEPSYSTESFDFPSSEINTASGEGFIDEGKLNQDSKEGSGYSQIIDGASGYSSTDAFTDQSQASSAVYQNIVNIPTDFYVEGSSSTSEEISTNTDDFATSTFPSQSPTTNEDDEIQHDQNMNINYPHITDDLSIHGSRMEEDEKLRANSRVVESELDTVDIQPLEQNSLTSTESLPIRLNTSIVDSLSTEAPLESQKESSNFNDIEARSPGEPLLIPEWERNHTTVAPIELFSASSEASEDSKIGELSSHSTEYVSGDETTTNQSDLSSSTDFIATQPFSSESDKNSDVASQEISAPSQFKETNILNLLGDGLADFYRIQKKSWDSAVV